MEERGIAVADVRAALDNGEDIEVRPDEHPYPARLVLGMCVRGALHVAVRDNLAADETAHDLRQPGTGVVVREYTSAAA